MGRRIATEVMDEIFISSQDIVEKILVVEVEVESMPVYPFCICKTKVPGSDMVYCDKKDCRRGVWFRLDCMDMEINDVLSDSCNVNTSKKEKKAEENDDCRVGSWLMTRDTIL